MKKHFMKLYLIILSVTILNVFAAPCFALESDNQKPATINANSVTYNRNSGIAVFTGNVQITQGTTQVTAAQLTTYMNSQNKIQKAIALGNPATYQSQSDNNKGLLHASANTIQYFPDKELVILLGNAIVTQNKNVLTSSWISYDKKNGVVKTATAATPQQRSTIILQPQGK